jgi:quercetin dioxygenase-like cupin family protein
MGRIEFIDSAERRFAPALDSVSPARLNSMTESERDEAAHISTFTHHAGDDVRSNLFEVHFEADARSAPHAHGSDEIIVVTEGEIHFGRRVFGPGSSVFIPKKTLYSFKAGPRGLTFLNFRPRRDTSIFTRDQLAAYRTLPAGPT